MRVPRLERLRTISELARMVQRPKRTLFRQLLRLHAVTRDNAGRPWLHRAGTGRGRWYVNLSILRSECPALFERRFIRREEFEELTLRVERIETELGQTQTRLRTVDARTARPVPREKSA